jgi:hypothetical protein
MEEDLHMQSRSCPFYVPEGSSSAHGTNLASHSDSRRCRGAKCAIWIGTAEEGSCSVLAIAQALSKNAG